MRGVNGIQCSVHPKFWSVLNDIRTDRVALRKERSGQLSIKRLSLTLYKLLKQDKLLYNKIVEANIDLNED